MNQNYSNENPIIILSSEWSSELLSCESNSVKAKILTILRLVHTNNYDNVIVRRVGKEMVENIKILPLRKHLIFN